MTYKVRHVKRLAAEIDSVTTGGRSENRAALASVYTLCLGTKQDSFVPKLPVSMLQVVPVNLRKKVDASCPRCIHPDRMARIVADAKQAMLRFRKDLAAWLQENDNSVPFKLSDVHTLKPS